MQGFLRWLQYPGAPERLVKAADTVAAGIDFIEDPDLAPDAVFARGAHTAQAASAKLEAAVRGLEIARAAGVTTIGFGNPGRG